MLNEDGGDNSKLQVVIFKPPGGMARGVPARRQWQSVVRSLLRGEELSPTSCLGSTTMKVNRGEGGGAGPANPKGQVKGAKKGLAGRKPGLKVKVREKVGGVVGAGGRKGGVANSRAEGGGELTEAIVPSLQPGGSASEEREGREASVKEKTLKGKKGAKKGKVKKDVDGEKVAGGTEGKRKIGSSASSKEQHTSTSGHHQVQKKKNPSSLKNNPAASSENKRKGENSIKIAKTKGSSAAVHNSDLENEDSPNVPQKDSKSSLEKKSESGSENNPKVKSEKSHKPETDLEKKRLKKKLDKAVMAKRKLSRMKKLGFLSAPPRR